MGQVFDLSFAHRRLSEGLCALLNKMRHTAPTYYEAQATLELEALVFCWEFAR